MNIYEMNGMKSLWKNNPEDLEPDNKEEAAIATGPTDDGCFDYDDEIKTDPTPPETTPQTATGPAKKLLWDDPTTYDSDNSTMHIQGDVSAAQREETATAREPINTGIACLLSRLPKPTVEYMKKQKAAEGEGLTIPDFRLYQGNDKTGYTQLPPLVFRGINIICARLGEGKTLALNSIMGYLLAKTGKHIVLFSLEETDPTMEGRAYASTCYYRLNEYDRKEQRTAKKVAPTYAEIEECQKGNRPVPTMVQMIEKDVSDRLIVVSNETIADAVKEMTAEEQRGYSQACGEIKAHASNAVKSIMLEYMHMYGADNVVFFIDYTQLMTKEKDTGSYGSRAAELHDVMNDLIVVSRKGGIIFAAAQMNREASQAVSPKDKKEMTDDQFSLEVFAAQDSAKLRDADDIGQAANVILGVVTYTDEATRKSYMRVKTFKARGAARFQHGVLPVTWSNFCADIEAVSAPTNAVTTGELYKNAVYGNSDDIVDLTKTSRARRK